MTTAVTVVVAPVEVKDCVAPAPGFWEEEPFEPELPEPPEPPEPLAGLAGVVAVAVAVAGSVRVTVVAVGPQ
jgi:hypothetical protein